MRSHGKLHEGITLAAPFHNQIQRPEAMIEEFSNKIRAIQIPILTRTLWYHGRGQNVTENYNRSAIFFYMTTSQVLRLKKKQ